MSIRDQVRMDEMERQLAEILGRLSNSDHGLAERVQKLENQYRMLVARSNKKNNDDPDRTPSDH